LHPPQPARLVEIAIGKNPNAAAEAAVNTAAVESFRSVNDDFHLPVKSPSFLKFLKVFDGANSIQNGKNSNNAIKPISCEY